ncbi:hypothetical protein ABW21_db0204763 [Orbilia brochopaga]|nr:hypothetical protein ABW21_db0204763 [Drechslerella brochopaga]
MERQLREVREINAPNGSNNNNTVLDHAATLDHDADIDADFDGASDIFTGGEGEAMGGSHMLAPEEWMNAVSFPNHLIDNQPDTLQAFTTRSPTSPAADLQADQPSMPLAPALTLFPHRGSIVKLPSKSCALVAINHAFESFNKYFPLFNETSFLRSFHANYSSSASPSDDPAWWASINVALALGHLFRAMRTFDRWDNDLAYSYTQNALWVVTELIALPKSLSAIQSLLGIAAVLEGTPHSQLCSVVIATAMRLAHAMRLHRRADAGDPTLTAADVEERKNVFWIAYWLDKNITFLKRQPSAQDDDDIDVDLPAGIISQPSLFDDDDRRRGTRTSINLFNSRIALAIIQGQIYKRLYSVKAARATATERVLAAAQLDAILACWRTSVPFDFGKNTVTALQLPIDECILHTIVLRLVYVDCLITVRRHMQQDRYDAIAGSRVDASPQNHTLQAASEDICETIHQVLPGEQDNFPRCPLAGSQNSTLVSVEPEPESLCVSESREAIALIQKLPKGDYACIWLMIDHFSAAVTLLLENVIQEPMASLARSDLALIEPCIQLLEELAERQHSADAQRINESYKELYDRAKNAVDGVRGD